MLPVSVWFAATSLAITSAGYLPRRPAPTCSASSTARATVAICLGTAPRYAAASSSGRLSSRDAGMWSLR
jgi:hypothetical protein